jgi:hypothetical protein
MGTFAVTANVDHRLSFADQGKQIESNPANLTIHISFKLRLRSL